MGNSEHLTDEQLARYQDGDLPINYILHLKSCSQCSRRLYDAVRATELFTNYLQTVRKPFHPPVPKPWKSLRTLTDEHRSRRRWAFRWWPAAALAAGFAGVVAFFALYPSDQTASNEANRLLTQASETARPLKGQISMTVRGQTFFRPAVLTAETTDNPELAKIQAAFVRADYSWQEPLSARSLLAWRNRLKKKRDTVSVIGNGSARAYRIRTESSASSLRAASLTLQASDMHPTAGSFEFEQEGTVDLTAGVAASPKKSTSKEQSSTIERSQRETLASPEDTLRVLVALNTIGADVDDPISISESADRYKILVRGSGLNSERQRQITEALRPLPRVAVDFTQSTSQALSSEEKREKYSANIPEPIRKKLEERFGGAIALQEVTDATLDLSASLVARSHALQLLAEKIPSATEKNLSSEGIRLLRTLRWKHIREIKLLSADILMKLKPLAAPSKETPSSMATSWQSSVYSLAQSARELNASLNRLLAGSYSETAGEEMIRSLPTQLTGLDKAAQLQERQ